MDSIINIPLLSGLTEINNPCTLVNLAVFVMFLGWMSEYQVNFKKFGWIFLVALVLSFTLVNLWPFELLLYNTLVINTIRVVYLALAVVFFALGIVHLYDWVQLKRGKAPQDVILKIPDFTSSLNKKVKIFQHWWLMSISIPLALSILHSIWPIEYYMGVLNAMYFFPGSYLKLFILLMIYSASTIVWLFAFFIILLILIKKDAYSRFVSKYFGFIKIVCAGFLCAVSIGLIYVFL